MFWFFWLWGMWDFSSLTRDRIRTPCIGRLSLNHWTAREVPRQWYLSRGLNEVRTQTMRISGEIIPGSSSEDQREDPWTGSLLEECGKRMCADSRTYWTLVMCFAHITSVSPHHARWVHCLGPCCKWRNWASEKLRTSPHISHLVNKWQSPGSHPGSSARVAPEAGLRQQGASPGVVAER